MDYLAKKNMCIGSSYVSSSAPTPSYFNDDDIPDFLVKYQNGPGFPVYYSSQVFASFCNLLLNCDIYLLYFDREWFI
jgi:hypothetical protein